MHLMLLLILALLWIKYFIGNRGELSTYDLAFFEFCRRSTDGEAGAITALRPLVLNALRFYNIDDLEASNGYKRHLCVLPWQIHMGIRHQYAPFCSYY